MFNKIYFLIGNLLGVFGLCGYFFGVLCFFLINKILCLFFLNGNWNVDIFFNFLFSIFKVYLLFLIFLFVVVFFIVMNVFLIFISGKYSLFNIERCVIVCVIIILYDLCIFFFFLNVLV